MTDLEGNVELSSDNENSFDAVVEEDGEEDVEFFGDNRGDEDRVAGEVVVERLDIWDDGDSVEPVDGEKEKIITRLRAVFSSKEKWLKVPSLKSRNRSLVAEQVLD